MISKFDDVFLSLKGVVGNVSDTKLVINYYCEFYLLPIELYLELWPEFNAYYLIEKFFILKIDYFLFI